MGPYRTVEDALLKVEHCCADIGALIIGIGFGAYYIIFIIKDPQNPMLIMKAPTLIFSATL